MRLSLHQQKIVTPEKELQIQLKGVTKFGDGVSTFFLLQ